MFLLLIELPFEQLNVLNKQENRTLIIKLIIVIFHFIIQLLFSSKKIHHNPNMFDYFFNYAIFTTNDLSITNSSSRANIRSFFSIPYNKNSYLLLRLLSPFLIVLFILNLFFFSLNLLDTFSICLCFLDKYILSSTSAPSD